MKQKLMHKIYRNLKFYYYEENKSISDSVYKEKGGLLIVWQSYNKKIECIDL